MRLIGASPLGARTAEEPSAARGRPAVQEWSFEQVDLKFFHLAWLAALPLMEEPTTSTVLRGFDKVDGTLLRRSQLAQDLAWFVTLELRGPKVLKTN